MSEVKIIGTGSYTPENIITNDDLSKLVDTSDEWISTVTGIKERRISKGENTSEIATKAALKAIEMAGISPEEIDLLVLATVCPDGFVPSTACMVQANIGAINATSFDINAACSGFIYGVNIATQFIKTNQSKTALVIGAEVLSKIIDWEDRNTCVLFGDGAGAAVLTASEEKGVIAIHTGSDGSKAEFLTCDALPVRNPYAGSKELSNSYVSMNGREVFKFASKIIPDGIQRVLENSEYNIEDVEHIIPHQANLRIIEAAAKRLKIDQDKFYVNINRYGNTSSASIPIALDEMVRNNLLKKGEKAILVGFGGGLTWGSALIQW